MTTDTFSFYVGADVSCRADIATDGLVHIDGKFNGTITGDCNCVVGKSGVVASDMQVRKIVVAGRVEGSVTATERIVLLDGAAIHAELTAPSCDIEFGASVNGNVTIETQAQKQDAAHD